MVDGEFPELAVQPALYVGNTVPLPPSESPFKHHNLRRLALQVNSRVGLFEQIRRDRDREGLSVRALAERHGVHRRAVRQALESAVPPARRSPRQRAAPKLGAYRELIHVRPGYDRPRLGSLGVDVMHPDAWLSTAAAEEPAVFVDVLVRQAAVWGGGRTEEEPLAAFERAGAPAFVATIKPHPGGRLEACPELGRSDLAETEPT